MAGTCAEYDWNYELYSEQTTPLKPATLYGVCKHALQGIVDAFCRQTGVSYAWGRIFFLYGPNEHPDRLVSSVIRSLLQGEPAHCSHGNQLRDFLHVEDVAHAFVMLLDSDMEGAVNIGQGNPTSIREVVEIIGDQLHGRQLIQLGSLPAPPLDPPSLIADTHRLKSIGWYPKYTLKTGLEQTIAWWKTNLITTKRLQE
jgi:nucleoside-diphosphate-sugar epimerase